MLNNYNHISPLPYLSNNCLCRSLSHMQLPLCTKKIFRYSYESDFLYWLKKVLNLSCVSKCPEYPALPSQVCRWGWTWKSLVFVHKQSEKLQKRQNNRNLDGCFSKNPISIVIRERGMITMIHLASSRPWESVPDQHREDEGRVLSVHLLEPGLVVIWMSSNEDIWNQPECGAVQKLAQLRFPS